MHRGDLDSTKLGDAEVNPNFIHNFFESRGLKGAACPFNIHTVTLSTQMFHWRDKASSAAREMTVVLPVPARSFARSPTSITHVFMLISNIIKRARFFFLSEVSKIMSTLRQQRQRPERQEQRPTKVRKIYTLSRLSEKSQILQMVRSMENVQEIPIWVYNQIDTFMSKYDPRDLPLDNPRLAAYVLEHFRNCLSDEEWLLKILSDYMKEGHLALATRLIETTPWRLDWLVPFRQNPWYVEFVVRLMKRYPEQVFNTMRVFEPILLRWYMRPIVTAAAKLGWTAAHLKHVKPCWMYGYDQEELVEFVTFCLSVGLDLNKVIDDSGENLLFVWSEPEKLRFLVEHGVNTLHQSRKGDTPLLRLLGNHLRDEELPPLEAVLPLMIDLNVLDIANNYGVTPWNAVETSKVDLPHATRQQLAKDWKKMLLNIAGPIVEANLQRANRLLMHLPRQLNRLGLQFAYPLD